MTQLRKPLKELYISVDIEADGPIPGPYSMTALGASVAGWKTSDGTLGRAEDTLQNRFYAELRPISDNYVLNALKVGVYEGFDRAAVDADPDGTAIRAYLYQHGDYPDRAMRKFQKWLDTVKEQHQADRIIFAGYPLGFDWMFTYWYLIQFTGESRFGFSGHLDMKTLYYQKADTLIARTVKSRMKKSLLPNLPHTHKAVDDAVEQGVLLMNILEWDPSA